MSKAAYWQRGESLDYLNETSAVIEANTIIPMVGRIGIAGTSINPHEMGSVHVTGIYEMEKTGDTEIKQGTAVYFDGEGITAVETGNTPAGYAAQTASAGDKKILVKLLG